jgi:hypothetical protein
MNVPKPEEARNEIAKKYGYPAWGNVLHDLYENNITPKHLYDYEIEAMKLYGEQLLRLAAERVEKRRIKTAYLTASKVLAIPPKMILPDDTIVYGFNQGVAYSKDSVLDIIKEL